MLFYLSLILLFSKKACDFMFPDRMNKVYIAIALHSLNVYSKMHMIVRRYYNWILHLIRVENDSFIFIKDGYEVKKCDISQLKKIFNLPDKYDMILYTQYIIPDYKYHDIVKKNIIRLDNCINRNYLHIHYLHISNIILSNIKLLDIKISYNNKQYSIDFSTEDNYYIVGNVLLDRTFIKWYLNKYHSILLSDNEEYTCNILDNNVNFIQIDSSAYIVIGLDDYSIETVIEL